MSRVTGKHIDHQLAKLGTHSRKLLHREASQVCRVIDMSQQRIFFYNMLVVRHFTTFLFVTNYEVRVQILK